MCSIKNVEKYPINCWLTVAPKDIKEITDNNDFTIGELTTIP
jgi:hypothetical protein